MCAYGNPVEAELAGRPKVIILQGKNFSFSMEESSFLYFQKSHIMKLSGSSKFANFIIFNAKFLVFDTQLLVLNTKFKVSLTQLSSDWWLQVPLF